MDDLLLWIGDWLFPALLVVLMVAVVALAVWGMSWVVCEVGARRWESTATVVGKAYQEDTQETSSVPVATGNGVGVGVVTTGHPRAWITLLENDGRVYEFDNVTIYTKAKVGQRLRVTMKHNAVSGTSISEAWVQP